MWPFVPSLLLLLFYLLQATDLFQRINHCSQIWPQCRKKHQTLRLFFFTKYFTVSPSLLWALCRQNPYPTMSLVQYCAHYQINPLHFQQFHWMLWTNELVLNLVLLCCTSSMMHYAEGTTRWTIYSIYSVKSSFGKWCNITELGPSM